MVVVGDFKVQHKVVTQILFKDLLNPLCQRILFTTIIYVAVVSFSNFSNENHLTKTAETKEVDYNSHAV